MTGSMTVLVTGGNLWGAGMSRAFATEQGKIGWIVPVAIQLLPALMILAMVPFTPGQSNLIHLTTLYHRIGGTLQAHWADYTQSHLDISWQKADQMRHSKPLIGSGSSTT